MSRSERTDYKEEIAPENPRLWESAGEGLKLVEGLRSYEIYSTRDP